MKKQVYIFGAGKNGKDLLNYLNGKEEIEVVAFIDNNRKIMDVDGIECIDVEEAIRRGVQNEKVLISPEKSVDIEKQLKENNFKKTISIKKISSFVPLVKGSDYRYVNPFNCYDSPYPDMMEVYKKEKELFDEDKEILSINFNVEKQIELLEKMKSIELPKWENEKTIDYRYYYDNSWFGKGSADALYYMIRLIKPRNIIEVGSGYSTAVMLDTNEYYFNNEIKIISIEPRTTRLKSLLKPSDNIEIYESSLQEMPISFFESLEENDILFIDSSHVSKIGSDVNYVFFEILPRLKKGVYIHFHDISYPFVYPKDWIYEGRAYNEMYVLRAFLMDNEKYSVQLFGSMLRRKYRNEIPEELLGCGDGSLWIKKTN